MELLDTVETVLRQKKASVWSIAPHATVYDALVLMAEKEIGSLLVMSGSRLVGLFSERDYARKYRKADRYDLSRNLRGRLRRDS